MKRGLTVIILLFLFSWCYAQKDSINHCAALQEAIHHKMFCKWFGFLKDTNLILIDRAKFFKGCSALTKNGRSVTIIDTCPAYIAISRTTETQKKMHQNDLNKIVVNIKSADKKEIVLQFWHPCSNGDLLCELKKRWGKIHVKILGYGAY